MYKIPGVPSWALNRNCDEANIKVAAGMTTDIFDQRLRRNTKATPLQAASMAAGSLTLQTDNPNKLTLAHCNALNGRLRISDENRFSAKLLLATVLAISSVDTPPVTNCAITTIVTNMMANKP